MRTIIISCLFLFPVQPRKPNTKESEVKSHQRTELNQTEDLPLTLTATTNTAIEEDLDAETSPDLIEGDIAISKVSGEIAGSLCLR